MAAGPKITGFNHGSCILMEVKGYRLMYCVMSVHIRVEQIDKIFRALYCGVPHKHMVVLGC